MADENVEKAKGKKRGRVTVRHRSERRITYENLNHPSHLPTPHPADDDDDQMCAQPDAVKGTTGNPHLPGGRSMPDRVSPPVTAGHQSPSSGDHGARVDPMNMPGPRELAFRHPDLRQGTTAVNPLVTMRTRNQDRPDADIIYTAGQVGLSRLDAAGATGMAGPDANPVSRPLDHIARNSATPPNGGHSLADPRSHAAPMAAKSGPELRAELKRMLFPGSGGGR